MQQRHRGAAPEDARLFGAEAAVRLRRAASEIVWLLDRGYPTAPAVQFVGGHHQIEARQRLALSRSVCSRAQRQARLARALQPSELSGTTLRVDGFNIVIALEVALSGGVVIEGFDTCMRDLAGLRGSYHLVEETAPAIQHVGEYAVRRGVRRLEWLLDAPVSNSGRLRAEILRLAGAWPLECEVNLVPNPDKVLVHEDCVVTSDAAILDRCGRWANLASWIVQAEVPQAWKLIVAGCEND